MILTGPILKQRCQEIWGNDWPSRLSSLLGKNRITAWRWAKRKTGHARAVKTQLLTAAEEQLRITAILVDELRDDLGKM